MTNKYRSFDVVLTKRVELCVNGHTEEEAIEEAKNIMSRPQNHGLWENDKEYIDFEYDEVQ